MTTAALANLVGDTSLRFERLLTADGKHGAGFYKNARIVVESSS